MQEQYNKILEYYHLCNRLLFEHIKKDHQKSKNNKSNKIAIRINSKNRKKNQKENSQTETNDFMKIESNPIRVLYNQEQKINQLRPNYLTRSQVNQFFSQNKKSQAQKFSAINLQIQQKFSFQKVKSIPSDWRVEYQSHVILKSDLETLKINKNLNDTIINVYLQLIKNHMINSELKAKVHVFSTFFISKLLNSLIKNPVQQIEIFNQKFPQVQNIVQKNYASIKRWTKNIDIFQKQYIIIPMNVSGNHWNLIIILHLDALIKKSNSRPCILYLDSFEFKNPQLIESIRIYLRKQLIDKGNYAYNFTNIEINQKTLPDYQLILPRQTNYHDCGIYLLSYVETLLQNINQLEVDFSQINNRDKLQLFPRSIFFTMRMRLMQMFLELQKKKQPFEKIIKQYLIKKKSIIQQSKDYYYDKINEEQFKRFLIYTKKEFLSSQNQYIQKLIFYMSQQYNHYEKF